MNQSKSKYIELYSKMVFYTKFKILHLFKLHISVKEIIKHNIHLYEKLPRTVRVV